MDKLFTAKSVGTGYQKHVSELTNAIVADDFILASSLVLTHVLPCQYSHKNSIGENRKNLGHEIERMIFMEGNNINSF